MKQYNSQKVECECGCIVKYGNLSEHKKSLKHNRLIQSNQ